MRNYGCDEEEDDFVDGLFGDRHSSVRDNNYQKDDTKNFDRDKYNEDGNPRGWTKTKETW